MNNEQRKARALELLKEIWGQPSVITKTQLAELRAVCGEQYTPIEAAIRTAGLWDQYVAADHPTWESFRAWIRQF